MYYENMFIAAPNCQNIKPREGQPLYIETIIQIYIKTPCILNTLLAVALVAHTYQVPRVPNIWDKFCKISSSMVWDVLLLWI